MIITFNNTNIDIGDVIWKGNKYPSNQFIMPFGKYKGRDWGNVVVNFPDYALWFLDNIKEFDVTEHVNLYLYLNGSIKSKYVKPTSKGYRRYELDEEDAWQLFPDPGQDMQYD